MTGTEICELAIKFFGADHQKIKAVQELNELAVEITKDFDGRADLNHIAEEIADVEIMLYQMKVVYDLFDSVDKWRHEKLVRLAETIAEQAEGK